jgi:hypothetical protein
MKLRSDLIPEMLITIHSRSVFLSPVSKYAELYLYVLFCEGMEFPSLTLRGYRLRAFERRLMREYLDLKDIKRPEV